MNDALRAARAARGLSQAALARRAGVSRQLVGAVEAGRHAPSVGAALALARALGTSVEELFGAPPDGVPAVGALGPVADGEAVVAARVGDVVTCAALPERAAGAASWRAADGVWSGGRVTLFPGAAPDGIAAAGCDPALGLAADLLPERGPRRVAALHASSAAALAALDAGRVHVALVHGPEGALPPGTRPADRTVVARWDVGVATRPGARVALSDVAAGRATVARRERGAAAQVALERALAPFGAPAPRAVVAFGHLDAARRVAYGAVDAAVTMRPAARACGLDFAPLEEHVVELRVASEWAGLPGVVALAGALASPALRARLDALGGYEPA